MVNLLFASKFTAKVSTSLFTGAAIYINLVEHPARLECGTRLASTVWVPSFKKAATMQIILSSLGCISAFVAYNQNKEKEWLIASLLIGSTLPYTLFAIKPTLDILLDSNIDRDALSTKVALVKWGRLHAVRSIAGFFAMLTMLYYG